MVVGADQPAATLKSLADRITADEKRHVRANRRLRILAAFVVLAFLLLAWRTERNQDRIAQDAKASCARSIAIITEFNALQDRLIEVERTNTAIDPRIRDARIAAYESGRILPLPTCPPRMTPTSQGARP